MELLKLLDFKLIVAQVVCFALVYFLLKHLLWTKIFKVLEDRRSKVEGELKAIETTRLEVARLKGEYETFLSKVEEISKKRLKEYEAMGEVKAQEIREHARQEAERIVADAKKEITFEFAKSREVLKTEIVEMVISATEHMIQEKLSFENDKKIIEGILTELDKPHA
ncbi:MAG: F0F1 ATP synthase subunit B [Candidatus Omnitrophica bacterium]|nr:F0F1 ATP synthase subunit B [Candidatus Omnitrophota bacterium]